MRCPACNKKFNYFTKVKLSRSSNLRVGFPCPYCHVIIRAKNISLTIAIFFSLIIFPYFIKPLIYYVVDKCGINIWLAFIYFGYIAFVILLAIIFMKVFIKLEIKERPDIKKHLNHSL